MKEFRISQELVSLLGDKEKALQSFFLCLISENKEDYLSLFQNKEIAEKIWDATETMGVFHGGTFFASEISFWYKLCLLTYAEQNLPHRFSISGLQIRYLGTINKENNTRCLLFKTNSRILDENAKSQNSLVCVFSPFLPKTFAQELVLGFGTMCDTKIDQSSGIHSGILGLSEKFTSQILSAISNEGADTEIWFVGMSLGGAMAQSSLWNIRNSGFSGKATVVTFGSPRVGNKNFCSWLKRNCDSNSKSVILVKLVDEKIVADPVSLFPPKDIGYCDSPFSVFLNKGTLFWNSWLRTTQKDLDISISGCLYGLIDFQNISKYGISNMGIGDRNEEWKEIHDPQKYFDNL